MPELTASRISCMPISRMPYRFTSAKFSEFLDQIASRRNIIPKGFKVSEYDKGFPWPKQMASTETTSMPSSASTQKEKQLKATMLLKKLMSKTTPMSADVEAERPRLIKVRSQLLLRSAMKTSAVARETAVREFEYSGIEPGNCCGHRHR